MPFKDPAARKAYQARYHVANAERLHEKARARYLANSDHIKAKTNAYYYANRERVKDAQKRYVERNRPNIQARRRAYYANLVDYYVKQLIIADQALPASAVPQDLVDAKREHLKLTRLLKEKS